MRLNLNKVIKVLMTLILCANIIIPISIHLDNNKSIFLVDHAQFHLNIINGPEALIIGIPYNHFDPEKNF